MTNNKWFLIWLAPRLGKLLIFLGVLGFMANMVRELYGISNYFCLQIDRGLSLGYHQYFWLKIHRHLYWYIAYPLVVVLGFLAMVWGAFKKET